MKNTHDFSEMADSDKDSGGTEHNSKSNSNNKNRSDNNHGESNSSAREQDRFLPIANVGRIMKKGLPANGKISKDAKETMQECVSEFISFVTGEASEKCQNEKRKTINGDDLIWAMATLGFEDYVDPLKIYLQKFREVEGEKTELGRSHVGDDGSGVNSGNFGFGFYGDGMGSNMMMMGNHHHHHK